MKKYTHPRQVPHTKCGEGLPYAPINWPNPGDNWGWKVVRRFTNGSLRVDRYLIAPLSLQVNQRKKLCFRSKKSLQRYLLSEFPDTSIDAFFASFSWRVPSNLIIAKKEKSGSQPPRKETIGERVKASRKSQRPTAWFCQSSSRNMKDIIDISSSSSEEAEAYESAYYMPSHTDSQNTPVANSHTTTSVAQCSSNSTVNAPCLSPAECQAKVIPNDFDNLLNSVDHILSKPISTASVMTMQEEMAEARKQLSLLLTDNNLLALSSTKQTELSLLSSKLKNDPTLSPEQHSMLMLIDEIPLANKEFREAKKVAEEADNFFVDLESNIALATMLKNGYKESKEKESLLKADVSSSLLEIVTIDKQIASLMAQRAALGTAFENRKREMDKLNVTQQKVVECLPKVIYEVQMANSKSAEWELKMKNSAMMQDYIVSKFAPLQGFSF